MTVKRDPAAWRQAMRNQQSADKVEDWPVGNRKARRQEASKKGRKERETASIMVVNDVALHRPKADGGTDIVMRHENIKTS